MQPAHYESTNLRIDKIDVGPYENNVYFVRCRHSGETVIIDAANEHEFLIPICRTLGVRRVLTTHGHHDHIQAVTAARDAGIDVGVSTEDAHMLPGYDFLIDDTDAIRVGDLKIRAVHTPGHTPGSLCFTVDDEPVVFSGDTLFPGGPGTTRLPGGDFDAIIRSIDEKLLSLDPDTLVFPGHGLDTTIGTERPQLSSWVARGW